MRSAPSAKEVAAVNFGLSDEKQFAYCWCAAPAALPIRSSASPDLCGDFRDRVIRQAIGPVADDPDRTRKCGAWADAYVWSRGSFSVRTAIWFPIWRVGCLGAIEVGRTAGLI